MIYPDTEKKIQAVKSAISSTNSRMFKEQGFTNSLERFFNKIHNTTQAVEYLISADMVWKQFTSLGNLAWIDKYESVVEDFVYEKQLFDKRGRTQIVLNKIELYNKFLSVLKSVITNKKLVELFELGDSIELDVSVSLSNKTGVDFSLILNTPSIDPNELANKISSMIKNSHIGGSDKNRIVVYFNI